MCVCAVEGRGCQCAPPPLRRPRGTRPAPPARRATAGTPEPVGTGGIADVFEEARLIEWPSPARALADTALVVAIVAGSAALLFVVNSGLTDLAKAIYD